MLDQAEDVFLTFPVIIMRNGGLDGVALQAREYRHLLNKMDIGVHVLTGRCETTFATQNPVGHQQTVVPRLDFYHEDSIMLFSNQFTSGDEVGDVERISEEEWRAIFNRHKVSLKEDLEELLSSIPHSTPVLVYNLVSLRHAHPAAAVAIRELMEENPDRAFISHSADPDAERPEKIDRIKEFVLPYISCNGMDEPYSGGPYNLPNLYHIVLNPTQRDNFLKKYNIPEDHVFEIPDFLDFPSREPVYLHFPKKIFIQFVADRCLALDNGGYCYVHRPIDKNTICFISPVRPVYRKRIKEAMLVARQYARQQLHDVVFIVTHPDSDDPQYFRETVEYAEKIGLPYYHLGEQFTLESLDTVYENMAAMQSVGVIASSAGGWENALNEMARACIPFFMDNKLNSFRPLTEEIGIRTFGVDFGELTPLVEQCEKEGHCDSTLADQPVMKAALEWVQTMIEDGDSRKGLIEHNYAKAYDYLSHEATLPRLVTGIRKIYEKHG